MIYDAENRLASAEYTDTSGTTDVDHRTEYSYSGDGMLAIVKKFEDSNPNPVSETRFVRSGFLVVQERDDSNNVIREYTWGLDKGGGIGGLLSMKEGGFDYYYLFDGKGNVMVVLDDTQTVVASYRYDAFGNLLKTAGSLDQPFRFSTKQYDKDTGLYTYEYRFYNPATGTWITRDPLGEAGGINLYGFNNNNAINYMDPWGLATWPASGPVTSQFGNRTDPFTSAQSFHNAIDISNAEGSAVVASDNGVVVSTAPSPNGTNQVIIKNDDGSVSGYAHVDPSVKVGQKINEGDIVGSTDLSGRTTGEHLHYTYRPDASSPRIDPLTHLPLINNYPGQPCP